MRCFADALRANPDLHLIAVIPHHPDQDGRLPSRRTWSAGSRRSTCSRGRAGPRRGLRRREPRGHPGLRPRQGLRHRRRLGLVGSDNINRRSWTHDSELSCAVVDDSAEDHSPYARRLRLTLAAEHLDRAHDPDRPESLLEVMSDCLDGPGLFAAYAEAADRLDAWHAGGRQGERPAGRLRRLPKPDLSRLERLAALGPYLAVHDPDGRPSALRKTDAF